jgi:hypothetical protein
VRVARLRKALAAHFFYSMKDREFVAGLLEAEEQLTLTRVPEQGSFCAGYQSSTSRFQPQPRVERSC